MDRTERDSGLPPPATGMGLDGETGAGGWSGTQTCRRRGRLEAPATRTTPRATGWLPPCRMGSQPSTFSSCPSSWYAATAPKTLRFPIINSSNWCGEGG